MTWQLEQEMTLVVIQIEHEKKKAAITGRTKSGKKAKGLKGCLLNQTGQEKWKWFALEMRSRIGMEVTPDQCVHKWDNLKQAYKCIRRVKEITGGRTYFEMDKEELRTIGKAHGLQAMPPQFSQELYDLLAQTMALSDEALAEEKVRPKAKPRKRERRASHGNSMDPHDEGGLGAPLDEAAERAQRDAEAAEAAKEMTRRHQERAKGLLITFCESMERVLDGGGAGDGHEVQQREFVRQETDQLRQRVMADLLEQGLPLEAEVAAAMIAQLETAGQALIALSYGKAPFSWVPDAAELAADAISGGGPAEDLDVQSPPGPLPAPLLAVAASTVTPPPEVPPSLWPPIPLPGFVAPATWQSAALAASAVHLASGEQPQDLERLD